MKELFVPRKFEPASLGLIHQANEIVDEYRAQGFVLTLRQLYYQFVARAIIPNKQTEYKRLGSVINDARLAGLMDWEMIEDRTRGIEEPNAWDSPEDVVRACADQYRAKIWETQPVWPEVWIEKEALVGVIEPVCKELRLPYLACRGYASQSELYRAGKRIGRRLRGGKRVLVLHLGDHDPSGIDMTRDNEERLRLFARSGRVEVKRIALNMSQVEEYNPPPNPAKMTDSRFEGYTQVYGDESWELDALDPTLIAGLIRDEVEAVRDEDAFNEALRQERADGRVLSNIADDWERVSELFGDAGSEEEE